MKMNLLALSQNTPLKYDFKKSKTSFLDKIRYTYVCAYLNSLNFRAPLIFAHLFCAKIKDA